MNDKLKLILAACIGTGGFAAGYFVGGGSGVSSAKSPRGAADAPAPAGKMPAQSGDVSVAGSAAEKSAQFASVSGATDKETRFFSAFREPDDLKRTHDLVDAAASLSLDELPGLLARIRTMPPDAREMLMHSETSASSSISSTASSSSEAPAADWLASVVAFFLPGINRTNGITATMTDANSVAPTTACIVVLRLSA